MRRGDISREPGKELVFHVDCVLKDPEGWRGKLLQPVHWLLPWTGKILWNGAAAWSKRLLGTDYNLYVAVTGRAVRQVHDRKQFRDWLEDQYGFFCAAVMLVEQEIHLRQLLTDLGDSLEFYSDCDLDRLARSAIRARHFTGWDRVGY